MYHLGVVKALVDSGLLPQVISGTGDQQPPLSCTSAQICECIWKGEMCCFMMHVSRTSSLSWCTGYHVWPLCVLGGRVIGGVVGGGIPMLYPGR